MDFSKGGAPSKYTGGADDFSHCFDRVVESFFFKNTNASQFSEHVSMFQTSSAIMLKYRNMLWKLKSIVEFSKIIVAFVLSRPFGKSLFL